MLNEINAFNKYFTKELNNAEELLDSIGEEDKEITDLKRQIALLRKNME